MEPSGGGLLFPYLPAVGSAFPVVVGGAVVVVAVVAYLRWRTDRERREKLLVWATKNTWSYVARDDAWAHRLSGTPFDQGSRRRATSVVSGTWNGRAFTAFDHRYTTQTRDTQGRASERHQHFGVVVVHLPGYLPRLELTPEGAGTRVVRALGGQDLSVEHAGFNQRYRVRATDERVAHALLHPRAVETLLSLPDRTLRFDGTTVVTWSDRQNTPGTIAARLGVISRFVDQIPRFVWLDHGYDPDQTRSGVPPTAGS
jgi:hypothetical protein